MSLNLEMGLQRLECLQSILEDEETREMYPTEKLSAYLGKIENVNTLLYHHEVVGRGGKRGMKYIIYLRQICVVNTINTVG